MCARTVVVLVSLSLPGWTQHGSTSAVNPYTGPDHARAGAKLYRAQCAGCHGIDGAGTGAGPSLTTGVFRHGASDEAVFQTISKGVQGTAMPGFAFTGLQTWQLVTHVRSLAIDRAAAHAKGDPQAGSALFRKTCAGCHMVGGDGGVRGPDLSGIGLKRSGPELRLSITDPNAEVSSEYWTVTGKTNTGQAFRGTRLNEDTHSLQIRDGQGKLASLWKRDLGEWETSRQSPMPSFTGKLTDSQIEDLIAYLTRLREER